MNIEALKAVRENFKMGYVLSFAEAMLIQQAIDTALQSGNSGQINRANSFTDDELMGMAHGDNPVANAYRELLEFRRNAAGGNSAQPVTVHDGYVLVPVEPTPEMIIGFWGEVTHGEQEVAAAKEAYADMLAAAPKAPDGWIPVSERMPEKDGNYWGWWSESKRQGPVWFIKSELQTQFQSSEITHWRPLPDAPKGV